LLISLAALAYEVLLIRLFSIIQWHHFAYMIISLALLGYGASGTYLTFVRSRWVPGFLRYFVINASLFGLSAILCFLMVQRLPFNTLEMFWDPVQWFFLLLSYLLLAVPFFFAANCICLAFARFGGQIPLIYAYDLVGAGLGALGIILLLSYMSPMGTLQWVGALGLLAAAIAVVDRQFRYRWSRAVPFLSLAVVMLMLPGHWLELKPSSYKALSQALQVTGTRVLEEISGPFGVITLTENPVVPLRIAAGLSLNNVQELPAQLGVYIDGEGPAAITRFEGNKDVLRYLDYQTSALPYHLLNPVRVLIVGLGGGSGILQASLHNAEQVDAVELNPQLIELVVEGYADFAGWNLLKAHTRIHQGEARNYVTTSGRRYDLIQVSLVDSASATSGGVHGLSEDYLYTLEAVSEYLAHLEPGGLLAVTRWLKLPPRDGLKLFATAVEALRLAGIEDPGRHLLLIRGWNTSTLVIGRKPVTEQQIRHLIEFCDARSFDLAYYPGIRPEQANVHNLLPGPYFYEGARDLLGNQSGSFMDGYKFDIRPTRDDRPYFFNFFKWSSLPEILSLYRQGGFSLLELGYPVLVLTLFQALVISAVLILIPLVFIRRSEQGEDAPGSWRILLYFLGIGVAFMFIEMAFIQKFMPFLGQPIHAVAVVLCGFLVFSGIGSLFAGRLVEAGKHAALYPIVAALILIVLSYLWLLPLIFGGLGGLGFAPKAAVTLSLIAPLAFCMGMPFPMGLSRVSAQTPGLLPWAWGINGCASLISAILATLLSVHVGFDLVLICAAAIYLTAVLLGYRINRPEP